MNSIKNRIRSEKTNPGPGSLFSIHIPISTKNNNKKEINNKIDKGPKIQKVLYLKCNRIVIKNAIVPSL